jgi:hypothetical protein
MLASPGGGVNPGRAVSGAPWPQRMHMPPLPLADATIDVNVNVTLASPGRPCRTAGRRRPAAAGARQRRACATLATLRRRHA